MSVQTRALLAGDGRSLQFVMHAGLFVLPGPVIECVEYIKKEPVPRYQARFTTLEKIKEFAKANKMTLFVDENFPVIHGASKDV